MAGKAGMTGKSGVYSDRLIREMCAAGQISAPWDLDEDQIQPASLDLRLGDIAYRVRASFLPGRDRSVEERIADFSMHEIDITRGAVLEKSCVYIVPLRESLALPETVKAAANAKSSTGRLDLLTRLLCDQGCEYDRVHAGYHGPLYVEICPRSFSVLVRTGSKLNQIRFRRGAARLSDPELIRLHDEVVLVTHDEDIDDGIGFSVNLDRPGRHVGYQARPHSGIIDIDRTDACRVEDYWIPVVAEDRHLILDPGSFYILSSREAVHIPLDYAAEMLPYLPVVGEFRVHYAGFFDPGFGDRSTGGQGSRGVLEVRCHEVPLLLEHGQKVGRLIFERMLEAPQQPYGSHATSHYQGQGLKLSKHFRAPARAA
ncbi:MAG: 2'-deoxycytidine 5'-triphosphate deaminase [Rhodobacteraceae bacterium]|nr:2'-deoxycytidine 5'-triphosphate deaminase [Paracoccaceae bacterium]